MSLHGTYDEQNIFAKIIRGEAPCYKLYEDEDVLAFLDLFPQSYGHCLVIPKHAPARNLLEIDDANLAKVMSVVRKLTQVVVDELEPAGVHVHIVPRYEGDKLGIHATNQGDAEELKALQARLVKRING